ncbi:MAG: hypothetical protein R3293_02680 [Candidatus Promineifilaceae bacterium]|nr:hypothetical protein [Candidatus Promineifilaceae bacterium]
MKAKSRSDERWHLPAFTLFVSGLFTILILSYLGQSTTNFLFNQSVTMTPQPLLPTRTASAAAVVETRQAASATATPEALKRVEPSPTPMSTVVPLPTSTAVPEPLVLGPGFIPDLERFGTTGGIPEAMAAYHAGLRFSHLLNWHVMYEAATEDVTFWQMIRVNEQGIRDTNWEGIERTIEKYPGSNWFVGNEPDVKWQDNVTPERYAEIYHEVYSFIKTRDPGAKLVIGGVAQPTPLRRDYLDIVLDTYQERYETPMPIDIWNVHAFTLREELDSWGVDIPPGMEERAGSLYEIEDHKDVSLLRQNLIEFRAWMDERGYGDKPLVISEVGILMPEDYGFDVNVTGQFMTDTFDMFLTEANETGYEPDGNRLIQWWFWFVVYDDGPFQTGILFDYPSNQLTPLGEIWVDYLENLEAGAG